MWPRRGTGRAARARERRRGGRRRCDAVAVVRGGGGATGGAGKELAGRAATVGGDAGHVATARALSARPGGGCEQDLFFFCLRAFRRGPARTQCQSGERDKASGQTFSMAQSPAGSSLRAHTHRFSAQRTRSGACGFSVARAQVEIAVHAFRLRHSLYIYVTYRHSTENDRDASSSPPALSGRNSGRNFWNKKIKTEINDGLKREVRPEIRPEEYI